MEGKDWNHVGYKTFSKVECFAMHMPFGSAFVEGFDLRVSSEHPVQLDIMAMHPQTCVSYDCSLSSLLQF